MSNNIDTTNDSLSLITTLLSGTSTSNDTLAILDILLSSPTSDTLSPELLERLQEMRNAMNRKKILEQYEIKQLPDGRWWIRLEDGTLLRKKDKYKLGKR